MIIRGLGPCPVPLAKWNFLSPFNSVPASRSQCCTFVGKYIIANSSELPGVSKYFSNCRSFIYLGTFSSLKVFHIQEPTEPSLPFSQVSHILCVPFHCWGTWGPSPDTQWPQITQRARNRWQWEARGRELTESRASLVGIKDGFTHQRGVLSSRLVDPPAWKVLSF